MAVDTTQSWQEHTSDGSTAYFPFNFNYDTTRPGTIVVGKRTADNTYSVVDASNYELIPNASGDGGQIRFIQNPSGSQVIDDIPPAGTIVRIERVSVDTSSATWQIGLEMSELVNLFDRLFRLVQENKGGFDNVIKTFETQHNVSLYELLSAHNNHLLYWDNTTHTLTPTDFPKEDVVRCVNGLFFRISTTQAGLPYLEWSANGSSDWHSSSATWGTIDGNINNQTDLKNALDAKQNTISDLSTIRSGAAKGATAVQPGDGISELTNDAGYITGISSSMVITALGYTPVNPTSLATVATTGQYSDLSGKPTIPTTLAGLTGDVSISSPTNGQSLQYDATLNKWKNVSSTVSIGFDGITGSPEDNVALKNALDLKADVATTYTKTEVNTALSGKANTDMNNLTNTGKNIPNWSTNVSNCITEIPQDINLELNNGTLTLKAGSKVYVPNGSGVFDVITIANDLTRTDTGDGAMTLYVSASGPNLSRYATSSEVSGTTEPTGTVTFYNTSTNTINRYSSGVKDPNLLSFPICHYTVSGGQITSIDQVFNGFGYIGHHIFVFPNVSVSIPDGLNTDGSLKSIRRTNNALRVVELVNTTNNAIFITNYSDYVTRQTYGGAVDNISEITTEYSWYYVREENMYCRIVNGALQTTSLSKIIDFTYNGAIISDFKSKTVFRAVDYNDFADLSNEVVRTSGDQTISGTKTFTGSNEFTQTVKAPSVYGYGSDGVRTASLEFIDGGNDNIARLVAISNNGNNAATADLHFNNGNPYFAVPSSDAVNAAVATLAKTKAQNGYFKLSNGLIIQWGLDTFNNTSTTINLPTAFTSTDYSVTCAAKDTSSTYAVGMIVESQTTSSFQAHGWNVQGTRTITAYWIAIGY